MYDERVRKRALELVSQGYSARKVSEMMGGRPGYATILKWAQGFEPRERRKAGCVVTVGRKVEALRRLEAGEDYRAVAADVGCSPSALLTWRKKYDAEGEAALRTRIDRYLEQTGE